jgi:hypothetical protein
VNRSARELGILLLALALVAPTAFGQSRESIFGTYHRQSITCGGGPGFADRLGRTDCNGVFEDSLEISSSLDLDVSSPSKAVFVEFGLHFGYSDYCAFRGHGTWSKGKVVLDKSEKPLPASCRLELNITQDGARLSDLKDNCAATLCTAPHKLHGVAYRKR